MSYLHLTPEQEAALVANAVPPAPEHQFTPEQAERMAALEVERAALIASLPAPNPVEPESTPTNTVMPLEPIEVTPEARANQLAQQFVNTVGQIAGQITAARTNGIPAVAAVPASQHSNGQTIPARPALPAVSKEALDAALGAANCALFDALRVAIHGAPEA